MKPLGPADSFQVDPKQLSELLVALGTLATAIAVLLRVLRRQDDGDQVEELRHAAATEINLQLEELRQHGLFAVPMDHGHGVDRAVSGLHVERGRGARPDVRSDSWDDGFAPPA